VAIAAAFTLAFSLMNGFKDSREAVQVESTARTSLDIVATALRSASPGLGAGQVWDSCNSNLVDTIQVTNSGIGPDSITVLHGLGGAIATLTSDQTILPATTLTVDANDFVSYDASANPVASAAFEKNTWMPALIIDPVNQRGTYLQVRAPLGSSTTMETQIAPGCLAPGPSPLPLFPAGSIIVRASFMTFSVLANADGLDRFLMIDPDGPGPEVPQIMADGIEDLQVAVGVENEIDDTFLTELGAGPGDDEWHYNYVGGETGPPLTSLIDGAWRAIRITLVGISYRDEQEGTPFARPKAEDRAADGTGDGFRRRTYSTTVTLRNFSAGN
jgi:hypothetical protein